METETVPQLPKCSPSAGSISAITDPGPALSQVKKDLEDVVADILRRNASGADQAQRKPNRRSGLHQNSSSVTGIRYQLVECAVTGVTRTPVGTW